MSSAHPVRRALLLAWLSVTSFACVTTPSPAARVQPGPTTRHAQVDVDDPLTTIQTYHVKRKILMVYRLDLMKDNVHSPGVAEVIRADEPQMRHCYTQRLNETTGVRGRLALTFELNKTTGRMERVTRAGGSLKDDRLVSCVTARLEKLTFNVPHDMSGKLDYVFDARDTVSTSRR